MPYSAGFGRAGGAGRAAACVAAAFFSTICTDQIEPS